MDWILTRTLSFWQNSLGVLRERLYTDRKMFLEKRVRSTCRKHIIFGMTRRRRGAKGLFLLSPAWSLLILLWNSCRWEPPAEVSEGGVSTLTSPMKEPPVLESEVSSMWSLREGAFFFEWGAPAAADAPRFQLRVVDCKSASPSPTAEFG